MKAPKFWYSQHRLSIWQQSLVAGLAPLSCVYKYLSEAKQHKQQQKQYRFDGKVVCVGNLVVGGGGKTPTALYLFHRIKKLAPHKKMAFLTRGFGGNIDTAHQVDTKADTAQKVGDEALLLAHTGPTIISKNRIEGAKLAEEKGYDLLIMDDGFQNQSLYKDLHILVIDSRGFGNGKLLPAGPLREAPENGLAKADLIINTEPLSAELKTYLQDNATLLEGHYTPSMPEDLNKGESVIGFAGIANPDKFHKTLIALGFDILDFHALGDHEPIPVTRLSRWLKLASKKKVRLVTTEKDYMRIPETFRKDISAVPISLTLKHSDALDKLLNEATS
tara:strand:- start:2531 stop:3529 length:999 start_codon:yes stop_codon:yes gene_type:complete